MTWAELKAALCSASPSSQRGLSPTPRGDVLSSLHRRRCNHRPREEYRRQTWYLPFGKYLNEHVFSNRVGKSSKLKWNERVLSKVFPIAAEQGTSDEDSRPGQVISAVWNIDAAIRGNYGEKLYIGEAWGAATADKHLSTGCFENMITSLTASAYYI